MATCCKVLACLSICFSSIVPVQAEERESQVEPAQIEQWVKQLDDDDFAVREAATQALVDAGSLAAPHVAQAVQGESLEVATRAFRILECWLKDTRPAEREASQVALARLAESENEENVNLIARRILAECSKPTSEDLSEFDEVVLPFLFVEDFVELEFPVVEEVGEIVFDDFPGAGIDAPVLLFPVEDMGPDAIWVDLALPLDVEELPVKSSIDLELPEPDSE